MHVDLFKQIINGFHTCGKTTVGFGNFICVHSERAKKIRFKFKIFFHISNCSSYQSVAQMERTLADMNW